eukprot:1626289-Pleurochrysis_carterae.AAC.8
MAIDFAFCSKWHRPPAFTRTIVWCDGEVVSVVDSESDQRTARLRTLLPAGALKITWPKDAERDEPESFAWTIVTLQNEIGTYIMHSAGRLASQIAFLTGTHPLREGCVHCSTYALLVVVLMQYGFSKHFLTFNQ